MELKETKENRQGQGDYRKELTLFEEEGIRYWLGKGQGQCKAVVTTLAVIYYHPDNCMEFHLNALQLRKLLIPTWISKDGKRYGCGKAMKWAAKEGVFFPALVAWMLKTWSLVFALTTDDKVWKKDCPMRRYLQEQREVLQQILDAKLASPDRARRAMMALVSYFHHAEAIAATGTDYYFDIAGKLLAIAVNGECRKAWHKRETYTRCYGLEFMDNLGLKEIQEMMDNWEYYGEMDKEPWPIQQLEGKATYDYHMDDNGEDKRTHWDDGILVDKEDCQRKKYDYMPATKGKGRKTVQLGSASQEALKTNKSPNGITGFRQKRRNDHKKRHTKEKGFGLFRPWKGHGNYRIEVSKEEEAIAQMRDLEGWSKEIVVATEVPDPEWVRIIIEINNVSPHEEKEIERRRELLGMGRYDWSDGISYRTRHGDRRFQLVQPDSTAREPGKNLVRVVRGNYLVRMPLREYRIKEKEEIIYELRPDMFHQLSLNDIVCLARECSMMAKAGESTGWARIRLTQEGKRLWDILDMWGVWDDAHKSRSWPTFWEVCMVVTSYMWKRLKTKDHGFTIDDRTIFETRNLPEEDSLRQLLGDGNAITNLAIKMQKWGMLETRRRQPSKDEANGIGQWIARWWTGSEN